MPVSDLALAELRSLTGKLVVSCQARHGKPLEGPAFMAAMAEAAVLGGAAGIRAEGAADIAAIRARVAVPILGIRKVEDDAGAIFITPDRVSVDLVVKAGARLVALDGTVRPRPGGREQLAGVIAHAHDLGVAALADVSTLDDALYAVTCGADAVGTTLSGYTDYSPKLEGPDVELVRTLIARLDVPVFAEGRYWTPDDVSAALDAGARFVVIGTAITNPTEITRRFCDAVARRR